LKLKLINAPIRQYPNFQEKFIHPTDALQLALGALLPQDEVGKDLPISYASSELVHA